MLEKEVRLSRWALANHRFRVWRHSYFDTTGAGLLYALDDEDVVASSERYFPRRLRVRLVLFALLAVVVGTDGWLPLLLALFTVVVGWADSLPPAWTMVFVASSLIGPALIALASVPSYLWIGTRTLVVRGLFGILTRQEFSERPHTAER